MSEETELVDRVRRRLARSSQDDVSAAVRAAVALVRLSC